MHVISGFSRYNRSRYNSIWYTQYRLWYDTDPLIVHSLLYTWLKYEPIKTKTEPRFLWKNRPKPTANPKMETVAALWNITRSYGRLISMWRWCCIPGLGNYIQRLTHLCLPRLEIRRFHSQPHLTSFGATKYFLDMLISVHKTSLNYDLAVHVVKIINYLSNTATVQ